MSDDRDDIRRKLDEVVGTEFHERGRRWGLQWFRRGVPAWIAGILLAIAMVSIVWVVLDRQLKAAHHAPAPSHEPVIIQIVPGK
ncbi:MAG TPA: hypothetical protein VFP36_07635 [Usitatibacter sp.]|nr:hypothetical protein [Usitatibacter sp.]